MKPSILLLLLSLSTISTTFASSKAFLENIAQKIQKTHGPKTVIFDLDDTIFDTNGRNQTIFKEMKDNPELIKKFPKEIAKMREKKFIKFEYKFSKNINKYGIKNPAFISEAQKFWSERFFSGDYLKSDLLVKGVKLYLERLKAFNTHIIYLTGRHEQLRKGTMEAFRFHELPFTKNEILIMKPKAQMEDEKFKRDVLKDLVKEEKYTVMATFENEPRNANLFQEYFKNATNVLLNTKHSGKPFSLHPAILKTNNFSYSLKNLRSPMESSDFRQLISDYSIYVEASGFFDYNENLIDLENLDYIPYECQYISKDEMSEYLYQDIFGSFINENPSRRLALKHFKLALDSDINLCINSYSVPYYFTDEYLIITDSQTLTFIVATES